MARPALHDKNDTLNKALNLFWSKGYQATSMKDLEQALDMRPGSIYAAFGNKYQLFREAILFYTDDKIARMTHLLATATDPLDGLTRILEQFHQPKTEKTPSCACFLIRSLIELENGEPEVKSLIDEQLIRMEDIFRQAFEKAGQHGFMVTPPPGAPEHDAAQLAKIFQMKLTGMRIMSIHVQDNAIMESLFRDCVKFLDELKSKK